MSGGEEGRRQRAVMATANEWARIRELADEALPGTDLSLFGAIAFIQRELWARRSEGADRAVERGGH